jgi:ABC-2 type transport system ATP-binding protein
LSYSIETKNLTKVFRQMNTYRDLVLQPFRNKKFAALSDVSINVEQGELSSLLGPTGAGKTTLLKIICNLVLPTSGSAFVNGQDVTINGKHIRKSIGYVLSDERSFYWRLTGRQNLKLFSVLNNLSSFEAGKRINEVLKVTDMTDYIDNMFKNYSSGQRQKMAIARGLLTDPQILIMDEPTKSLDPGVTLHLREFIKKDLVQQKGKTVFFATHNLSEAEELSDRITIIHKGKIAACGGLAQIRKLIKVKKSYVITLISSTNYIKDRIEQFFREKNLIYSMSESSGTKKEIKIYLELPGSGVSDVIEKIINLGGNLTSCIPKEISLQDIYKNVVERENG